MFGDIKAFEMKPKIFKRVTENDSFKYLTTLTKHFTVLAIREGPDTGKLEKQICNITELTVFFKTYAVQEI
jgi:hypothetical protein